jgi:hypothetical protein
MLQLWQSCMLGTLGLKVIRQAGAGSAMAVPIKVLEGANLFGLGTSSKDS